jgi:glycosyltransferase involved in cell wall biosynthesis
MHVLFVPSWYSTIDKPWRGAFFRDQATAIGRLGLEVGVAFVERRSLSRLSLPALGESHFQTESSQESEVRTVRMKGWSTFAQTTLGSLAWSQLMRRLVKSYVERYGLPDLIHGQSVMWGGWAAMRAAEDLGRPYVITEHSSSILDGKLGGGNLARARRVYQGAAGVMAVSTVLGKSVDRIAGASLCEVVPNAVDPDFFTLPSVSRAGSPRLLAVGDLVAGKRIDLLIRAFSRLRSRVPSARLVIVGSGKEEPRLRQWVHALALDESVELTGPLSRSGVRREMWKATALVLPSARETFSVVVIEALATGLPVLSTRCGGPEEIITPDLGVMTDGDDEAALAAGMLQIINRSFHPLRLRDVAIRRYSFRAVAERIRSVYERVARPRRRSLTFGIPIPERAQVARLRRNGPR